MKKRKINILILLMGLMSACYEDKSNYDYTPAETIRITGIESSYTKMLYTENIKASPTVTSSDKDADFEYRWEYYYIQGGVAGKMIEINKTKDLDFPVPSEPGNYVLIFKARNKKTNYTKHFETKLSIESEYTRGWFVAKSENNKADIDVFASPTQCIPNIFLRANKHQPEGKAVKMAIYDRYSSYDPVKKYEFTHSIFFLTEKDIWVAPVFNMKLTRDFSTLFIEAPSVRSPMAYAMDMQTISVINNGRIHGLMHMSGNYGQFSDAKWLTAENKEYKLAKYTGGKKNSLVLFDELSSSFLTSNSGNYLVPFVDKGSTLPAANTNKKMLYMGFFSSNNYYAVLEDKTTKERIIVKIVVSGSNVTITVQQKIKATSEIAKASYFTLSTDESLLYFVAANGSLYSYNIANGSETEQFRTPQDETITYIRHRNYDNSNDLPNNSNYMLVATGKGNEYLVRAFTKRAGNLSDEPVFILRGNGEVADVFYNSLQLTSLNNKNYPDGY